MIGLVDMGKMILPRAKKKKNNTKPLDAAIMRSTRLRPYMQTKTQESALSKTS